MMNRKKSELTCFAHTIDANFWVAIDDESKRTCRISVNEKQMVRKMMMMMRIKKKPLFVHHPTFSIVS
jgi:hypothetical protein